MPSTWRWKTISTWRSRGITCRSQIRTFCEPKPAVFFVESIRAWCRGRRVAVLEGSERALLAREQVAPQAARVALAQALQVLCNPHWVRALLFHHSILLSV